MDEIGTTFCITVDHDSLKDNTVTLKNLLAKKDEDNQITVPRKNLINEIQKFLKNN